MQDFASENISIIGVVTPDVWPQKLALVLVSQFQAERFVALVKHWQIFDEQLSAKVIHADVEEHVSPRIFTEPQAGISIHLKVPRVPDETIT